MIKERLTRFFRKFKEATSLPTMKILPGQLAFYFVLSLIPLISLVGFFGNFFSLSVESFIDFIKTSFPASTSNLIIPLLEGKGFDFSVLIFIVSAFLLASNGLYSVIITSNFLYKIKSNSNLRIRIKAVLLTVMLVILLGFIIIVPAFGDYILNLAKNTNFISPIFKEIKIIYDILEVPLSLLFVFFNIKLIYTIAPEKKIKSKDSTYGALFTTIGWILSSKLYSYYVLVFATYNIFYGSIANLISLLLWIYLLSYIFVVGLALNSIREKENEV